MTSHLKQLFHCEFLEHLARYYNAGLTFDASFLLACFMDRPVVLQSTARRTQYCLEYFKQTRIGTGIPVVLQSTADGTVLAIAADRIPGGKRVMQLAGGGRVLVVMIPTAKEVFGQV
ncbi:hypothetical protein BST61_g1450 [Cercospora zeina]